MQNWDNADLWEDFSLKHIAYIYSEIFVTFSDF